jgi:hypothetical protein
MSNQIECPNCGHHFDVENVIYHQAEEKLKKEFAKKAEEQQKILLSAKMDFEKEKEAFDVKKEKENEIFKERLEAKVREERTKIQQQTQEENGEKMKALLEENEKRKSENLDLKRKEIEILKKEQQLKEQQEELTMQMEKQMLEKRNEIELEIKKKEQEKSELRIKEYEKKLDDQKRLIEEMQRKAEQGSMQLQGEIQELALEELLRKAFPHDLIDEVSKGIRGADAIQTVVNPLQQVCGKIMYESKRTKAFSEQWIDKLKEDQRNEGATLAVIVTETMPKDMEKFGRKDGVWICTFSEVMPLVYVLREMLLREFSAKSAEENKGDKMSLLYGYLISEEFKGRIEGIVEGFSDLKSDLDREKRAMQKIWKEREKQIEKVIGNTIDMYSAIRGIAGNSVKRIDSLELGSNLLED